MKDSSFHSAVARWQPLPSLVALVLAHTALFFAARLALLYFLLPTITQKSHIAQALYIGLKFDLRLAVLLTLPLTLCLLIPSVERNLSRPGASVARKALCCLQSLLFGAVMLVYALDFGTFFYLHKRIDVTLSHFVEDAAISAGMMWESYPLVRITLCFLAAVLLYGWVLSRFLRRHRPASAGLDGEVRLMPRTRRAAITFVGLAGLFLAGYGQISSNLFPLRWSNAYFSPDTNIALLALNPVQNLYDTRRSGQAPLPDEKAARASYPRMAAWLGVPEKDRRTDANPLSFLRTIPAMPLPSGAERPNLVIIQMESLGWPRTSFAPPPKNGPDPDPTPFLRELAKKSLYYPNFFAPTRTTARAVFTIISGVPDVNHSGGTTTRNPLLVDQASLFNELKGYEKYYMIGGSASWANIRGLLQANIGGLRLMEENAWKSPNVDVWGVSDLAMLREAVGVFEASPKPFAAYIQTAGFHRPYTIPADNEGFTLPPDPSPETLRWYGFESAEEYHSIRFSDHALRRFFEKAEKEPWFFNTVFAIFGDHGLDNVSENMSPGYLACRLQAWHIPLLLYSPGGRIAPGVNAAPHTQLDIFPTLAALTGQDIRSTTLGRNLLDPASDVDAMAFISADDHTRYLIKDGYCYADSLPQNGFYKLDDPQLKNLLPENDNMASEWRVRLDAFYQMSKYLLYHNHKSALEQK